VNATTCCLNATNLKSLNSPIRVFVDARLLFSAALSSIGFARGLVRSGASGNPERRMMFAGKATVDRRKFGLGWSEPPMNKLAHEVELTFAIEAIPAE